MPSRVVLPEKDFVDNFEAKRLVELYVGLGVCLKVDAPAHRVSLYALIEYLIHSN